jgi:DNA-binding NtrC family response regulator
MGDGCRQILIVDSETTLLDALGSVLHAAPVQVVVAKSARCARSLLSRGLEPDVVLVNGAGWDRVGELERLARDPVLAAIPVLVITGKSAGSEAEEAARGPAAP